MKTLAFVIALAACAGADAANIPGAKAAEVSPAVFAPPVLVTAAAPVACCVPESPSVARSVAPEVQEYGRGESFAASEAGQVVREVVDATPSETAQMAATAVEVIAAFTATTARANAPAFGAALLSEAGEATEPTVLEDIKVVKESLAQQARILPKARSGTDCNLADLYRRRFLSGPWSVTRRLEAARIRGDTEEIERLTAMLEEIVGEALEVEGTEP